MINETKTVFLSGKLSMHPRLPKGAVGCLFVFPTQKEATAIQGDWFPIEIPKRELSKILVDNVRMMAIKNSTLEPPPDPKKKKKKKQKDETNG
jgi:hypothetical protein